jgi:hypothetical protein
VSNEPSNAASVYMRAAYNALNDSESPPPDLRSGLTDDFVHQDRRRGPTFPDDDAESFLMTVASLWDTGAGRPRFTVHETPAVRGDRLAAGKVEIVYGNGWTLEAIQLMELDSTLTMLQRYVDFDVDDIDGAIAELDRLHSQADAS